MGHHITRSEAIFETHQSHLMTGQAFNLSIFLFDSYYVFQHLPFMVFIPHEDENVFLNVHLSDRLEFDLDPSE